MSGNQDEVWIIQKSLSFMSTDIYASKSWLLTARTLYPRNFQIQYQSYKLEKMHKNPAKVAFLLEEMLTNFPQERMLWDEITQLTEVLQIDIQDEKSNFLKEVFNALPAHLQCHILLKVADTQTDVLQQCRLVMLVLQKYPEEVPKHGIKLTESLIAAEKNHQMTSAVNCYRKYLVCDLLPLVLKASLPTSAHPLMLRWLQKAMEFYIMYITQPPSPEMLMSPTGVSSATKQSGIVSRRTSIQGMAEKDCYISNPWDRLLELLCLTSKHLNWSLHNFFGNNNSELSWQQISSLYDHSQAAGDSDLTQVFYGCAVLGFHSIINYISKVEPDSLTGNSGALSSSTPLVLFEDIQISHSLLPLEKKKPKSDGSPQITANSSLSNSKEIIQHLRVAVKCWHLLQSDEKLRTDLQKLLEIWQAERWSWLHSFQVDYAIYQGDYKEAVSLLQKFSAIQGVSVVQLRCEVQLANCYYRMNSFAKSCESVMRVVQSLPQTTETSGEKLDTTMGHSRLLLLMPCCGREILGQCIQLLLACLKEKAFKSYHQSADTSMGHMIVLLQYDWPKYEHLFLEIVDRIKRKGTFIYNIFFNYVVNIDVLEEFAFLKSQQGGQVTLDILPMSTKLIAQSRTVTRGVNKVVKEDFKSALEKQVARSGENVESLIRLFLTEEKLLLQHIQ